MFPVDAVDVGRRIADYRKKNGMTAAQLAERVGAPLTRDVLAKIESGQRPNVSASILFSIAWELRVPPVALLVSVTKPNLRLDVDGESVPVWDVVRWFAGRDQDPWSIGGRTSNAGLEVAQQLTLIESVHSAQRHFFEQSRKHVEAMQRVVDELSDEEVSRHDEELRGLEVAARRAEEAYIREVNLLGLVDVVWNESEES